MPTKRDGELRSNLLCYFAHAFTDRCLVRSCVGPPVTLSSPITDHKKSQFLAADKCHTHKQWDKDLWAGHDEMNISGGQRINAIKTVLFYNRLKLPVQRSNVMQSTFLSSRETLRKNCSNLILGNQLILFYWSQKLLGPKTVYEGIVRRAGWIRVANPPIRDPCSVCAKSVNPPIFSFKSGATLFEKPEIFLRLSFAFALSSIPLARVLLHITNVSIVTFYSDRLWPEL